MDGVFAGHEACTTQEWINTESLAWNAPPIDEQSFHPNAAGQLGYAAAINAALATAPLG